MSLRFIFGPSGAGKSRALYEEIIRRSQEHPEQNFLVLVPDQFTMQTQKDLVTLHERGGIMNIDVLSFGRLAHRVFEETGGGDTPVLDDTGKSLVLQKVAAGMKEQLPCLGSFLSRQGYIHEVKSAISEFMQYGIGTEDVSKLISFSQKRGALVNKLRDLEILYRGFVEYIRGSFITTEETMDVLRRSLSRAKLIRGSVVAFDGFTGFTPIQNRVIQEIMAESSETIVTLTLGAGEDPYEQDGEQKLFHMSKKTVADLERLAAEAGTERGRDLLLVPCDKPSPEAGACEGNVQEAEAGAREENTWEAETEKREGNAQEIFGKESVLRKAVQKDGQLQEPGRWERFTQKCTLRGNPRHRFAANPALGALERNLFRYDFKPYQGMQDNVRLFEADTPREEVHQAGLLLLEQIRDNGLAYRDIAVITGDLEGYAPYVEAEFGELGIPCFIDRTRGIVLNPMIEYIKSALELYLKNFSYEAVFHYLRSGLSDILPEETDELENYVLSTGIRGYRTWSRIFTRKTAAMGDAEEPLERLNGIRERMMEQLAPLHCGNKEKVEDYVNHLYDFLIRNQVQQKLMRFERQFEAENQLSRAREYAQIYRLVMELLNQVYGLLGTETITLQEFADILEAGFGEIEVGTIPQNVDRVLVGDMERTRLKPVRVLFFLGVNDGNIPKNAGKGGIISDMDREFLRESGLELAPSPRQQMYIQRFYLYLNMTKPSHCLYLSYAKVDREGKAIRPAYLADVCRELMPGLETAVPQLRPMLEQVVSPEEGLSYLAKGLREYVEGVSFAEDDRAFYTLYSAYGEGAEEKQLRDCLTRAAFRRYRDSGLSAAVARALYGKELENSVSRLETYAACAYRHFLQYGLSLKEREEFGFEPVDMGNVFHGVLERFSERIQESGYTWFDFPEEFGRREVVKALEETAARYGGTVLYSSARAEYAITRMGRVLGRTVLTLQEQLKRGSFFPDGYELSFHYTSDLQSVNVSLSEEEKMRLRGRIDRIDVAEEGDRVYVKVIDYKSGNRQFDLAALYYGLQLQLVVYMNAAMELEAKKHPDKEIVPAALLYYHISDPMVESPVELSEEELNSQVLAKLRMNGVINGQEEIVSRLDSTFTDRSDIIPVEKKKDGSFSARSSVLSREELQTVSDYVNHKVRAIGREILDGHMELNPYEKGAVDACTYCPYKKVCGFDPNIPGCGKRTLAELDKREALEEMERAWESNLLPNREK